MPRGRSPTSRQNSVSREREREAFELRKAGGSLQQIGDKIGVSKQAVSQMLKRVLADLVSATMEDAEDVRHMEVERLDALLLGLWQKARAGNEGAVDRVLRIMQRRSELLGLDAPRRTTTEITGDAGKPLTIRAVELTDDQLAAIAAQAGTA
jgi:predicted DNA binding protein